MTKNEQTALQRAVGFLSRREHSRHELHWKLQGRDYSDSDIESALDRLYETGLQSDERFTANYVQSRIQRGYGPYKILAELKQRGVKESLARQMIDSDGIDWFGLAGNALVKKYGPASPLDMSDRLKRMRFLQQRGFTGDQIQYAVEHAGVVE